MDGVRVVPAHIFLVDGFCVVGDGAVIRARVPVLRQRPRQRQRVRDLVGGIAEVQEGEGFVVDVFIDGRRVHHVIADRVFAPMRPVVGLEGDFRFVAVKHRRFDDVFRPCVAVADLRAAQGVEVVQRRGAVFGEPEGFFLREVSVHFRRSFRPNRYFSRMPAPNGLL